jgi:hypothetical protein
VLETLRIRDALYGPTPAEAYSIDATSPQINPPAQLEAGLLKMAVSFRTSPSPARVRLEIARVSIAEHALGRADEWLLRHSSP